MSDIVTDKFSSDDKTIFCERRSARLQRSGQERFWASFPTSNPSVPFVEFTIVARTPSDAKRIAKEAAIPLGLKKVRID